MSHLKSLFIALSYAVVAGTAHGQVYNIVADFVPNNTTGNSPQAGLFQDSDGNLYGTTLFGGPNSGCNCGTVFKVSTSGVLTTLHVFNGNDGGNPFFGSLVRGVDGSLYGTTQIGGTSLNCSRGCGTVFKITTTGGFSSLHSFNGTDGSGPVGGLVLAANGNLYGTTEQGGSGIGFGGTVF